MDVATLEQWLWDAACEVRGPLDANVDKLADVVGGLLTTLKAT